MRLLRFLAIVFVVVLLAACHRKATAEGEPPATPPDVTDATNGLLFTWIDDKGEFHIEERPQDVPAASRDLVRVADPSRDVPADRIFLADLRTAGPDGKYTVRVAPRDDFERVAVERRKKNGAVLAAAPPASGTDPSAAGAGAGAADGAKREQVIIYGASWCGPCHQAQAYLKQRGIPFIEKDIEEDPAAAREMHAKLAKAGLRSGSIPVLDVRGRILVGFDPGSVDRALRQGQGPAQGQAQGPAQGQPL